MRLRRPRFSDLPVLGGVLDYLDLKGSTPGLPPGTLVHVGPKREVTQCTRATIYDEETYELRDQAAPEDLTESPPRGKVYWYSVEGVQDMEFMARLGRAAGLHPLVLEDVVNTTQRSKVDDYDDYLFMVFKTLDYHPEEESLSGEQVCLVLSRGRVISIQESNLTRFAAVDQRLEQAKGRIRTLGADYLAYVLLDTVVDHYFVALEAMGDAAEDLEESLIIDPQPEDLQRLHRLRQQVIQARRAVWPLREVITYLERRENPLITKGVQVYLRDTYDHVIQVIDWIEGLRDLLASLMDLYLSSASNRMNEVMRTLTVIATIFIPLTFLAGVYGMNFKYMPELEWHWAYPALWGVMLAVVAVMLWWFKRNHWF